MRDLPADTVPAVRVRAVNDRPLREAGDYVLYWMTTARRTTFNFGLQRAVEWARRLDRPLLVLEALRAGYPWASDRLHRFVLDGMAENRRRLQRSAARYRPYVEVRPGEGRGLLGALGERACVIVSDDYPCFFLPRMLGAAAAGASVRLEAVDGNGLAPLSAADRTCQSAHEFRRYLHKTLRPHLLAQPLAEPLRGVRLPEPGALPAEVESRWPEPPDGLLEDAAPRDSEAGRAAAGARLAGLPIDHGVGVVAERGGSAAGGAVARRFVDKRLPRYADRRTPPDPRHASASGLSPWLHFGHVGAHEVFAAVMAREGWTPARLAQRPTGRKEGWWGCSPETEAFLDELVTWRELGFHFAARRDDYQRYESLPDWARATLEKHAGDVRQPSYDLATLEAAGTHDPLWNAAQRQLLREGRIANYLRMLWGKKILQWSASPRAALEAMIQLNNRWALDGRDPNSFSGIFWCLGRFDRPWPGERPIFGTVRYMSSENTARKLDVEEYLARYGA
jgi:deoxyribodipyrimidine photo-lyase